MRGLQNKTLVYDFEFSMDDFFANHQ